MMEFEEEEFFEDPGQKILTRHQQEPRNAGVPP
jgi:hypothetical protein